MQLAQLGAYPKEPSVSETLDRGIMSGTRQDQVTYLPQSGGMAILPDITLEWFNLKTHTLEAITLPGRSFSHLLKGETGGREAVVVYDEYGPVRMIRDRRWKYIHRYPDGPCELYDLESDPAESENLVDNPAHRDTLARLRSSLSAWFANYVNPDLDGAGLPVTGRGQIDCVGPKARNRPAFEPRNP
jgi:hypothetical protein